MWVAVGFGPTIAALVGVSKTLEYSRAAKRKSMTLGSLETKSSSPHPGYSHGIFR